MNVNFILEEEIVISLNQTLPKKKLKIIEYQAGAELGQAQLSLD